MVYRERHPVLFELQSSFSPQGVELLTSGGSLSPGLQWYDMLIARLNTLIHWLNKLPGGRDCPGRGIGSELPHMVLKKSSGSSMW